MEDLKIKEIVKITGDAKALYFDADPKKGKVPIKIGSIGQVIDKYSDDRNPSHYLVKVFESGYLLNARYAHDRYAGSPEWSQYPDYLTIEKCDKICDRCQDKVLCDTNRQ
jgi:hypothetical protein